jgi:putative tryptophan/tyrosine transport system substrate-binding protein
MMQRREFIAGLGSAAAWPVLARAQQPALPVIGFLNSASADGYAPMVAAFRQGLKETIEGQNVTVEYRWAEGQYDRLPAMAAELVHRRVTLIVANTLGALAAKRTTTTIPIVFTTASDPVQIGLVASLSRPGGNATGATQLHAEVEPKRLELMHELVPTAAIVAVLVNPTDPRSETQLKDMHAAARILGVQLHVLHASTERDFDTVFATLSQLRTGALVISTDTFLFSRIEQLAALTVRHAVPAIFQERAFAAAGGLMSYGGSTPETYRVAGVYAGRILKGEKPADLPVQQTTKIELVINMGTAKALGLTIPETARHRRRGDTMMKRRKFIAGLGGAAAWPLFANAQEPSQVRRIAAMINYPDGDPIALKRISAFEHELERRGWTGTRKLQIEYRWNVITLATARTAVAELLALSPEVIFAGIGQALIAAKAATRTTPIVFVAISEPVSRGFVDSLAHPGGNITGFTNMEPSVGSKWLQLLKEIAPGVTRVAIVFNPESLAGNGFLGALETAAERFGVKTFILPIHNPSELLEVIEAFSRQPDGGLIQVPDGFSQAHRSLFAEATARHRLPAVYASGVFADAGGLMSYSVDYVEEYRQAAAYVDRILRGEQPADLPVQQPTKFELVINLKTAKALGLTIPETLLATADEVIQ